MNLWFLQLSVNVWYFLSVKIRAFGSTGRHLHQYTLGALGRRRLILLLYSQLQTCHVERSVLCLPHRHSPHPLLCQCMLEVWSPGLHLRAPLCLLPPLPCAHTARLLPTHGYLQVPPLPDRTHSTKSMGASWAFGCRWLFLRSAKQLPRLLSSLYHVLLGAWGDCSHIGAFATGSVGCCPWCWWYSIVWFKNLLRFLRVRLFELQPLHSFAYCH